MVLKLASDWCAHWVVGAAGMMWYLLRLMLVMMIVVVVAVLLQMVLVKMEVVVWTMKRKSVMVSLKMKFQQLEGMIRWVCKNCCLSR